MCRDKRRACARVKMYLIDLITPDPYAPARYNIFGCVTNNIGESETIVFMAVGT